MAAAIPNSAQAIPEHRLICRVCEKQYSKYTCPQCNLRYCSLPCYKNHSLRCTESFMRSNVMEEMRDIQATKESQQSMMEALKRVHFDDEGRSIFDDESLVNDYAEEDEPDDSRGTILSPKTFELIAEGGDFSVDDLSVEERKAFLRAVAAGEFSHLIQPWNPWWCNPNAKRISITVHGTSLVQSVNPFEEQERNKELPRSDAFEAMPGEVPAPPSEALVWVRQLMKVEPSPLISITLAELIYSYCFTLRFCNGDWESEPLEAGMILLSVSQVLGQAASPESIGDAFTEPVKTICSPTFKHAGGFNFAVALFDDSSTLLGLGRACVVCALADSHRMLESAKKDLKAELGVEKQEKTKHECKGRPGFLDDNSNSSSTVEQTSSREGSRGKSTQGNTYAELKKFRDNQRGLNQNRSTRSTDVGKTRTGLNGSRIFKGTDAMRHHHKQKKSRTELKKITAAIQKVYFFMCWANEQPNEVLSSLVFLIDVEKDRLCETGVTQINSGLQLMQEVKAPVRKVGPTIEEIVEKPKASETIVTSQGKLVMARELKAEGPRQGPIEELS